MVRPKHTKKDKTHKDLVKDCRDLGMVVWDLADLGGEVLDLMVFWRGKALPVEVKSPKGKLTEKEQDSIEKLRAIGVEPVIATCVEDVLKAFY
jgi:hypothetical protein